MNRPHRADHPAIIAIQERFATLVSQSERTLMLGTVLALSAISAGIGYVLSQCYSVDMLSSLLYMPQDCWLDWGTNIGRHCFSDYATVVNAGTQSNPWAYTMSLPMGNYQPFRMGYPAAGLLPQVIFGLPAQWLGAPRLGLICYLLALTIAVLVPAIWAARGAEGLERVVVFVAIGAAAIPAWAAIDRGNSAGFVVPIATVFLVALCRRRWHLVTVMVVLAALVKPQFAVLAIVLLVARKWRLGGVAFGGIVASNLAAYLLWPQNFPATIAQSIHNILDVNGSFQSLVDMRNVSFARGVLLIPDTVESAVAGKIPDGFLATPRSLLGYVILIVVIVSLLAVGRRIPPVMAGITLLATASLFPPLTSFYYLVFVLPIAAVIVRDPDGPPGTGIFDRLAINGDRRRIVGISVSLAVALSIAQVALLTPLTPPFPAPVFGQLGVHGIVGTTTIILTTALLTPILWMFTCAAIIVSYARRPANSDGDNQDGQPEQTPENDGLGTSAPASEVATESS